MKIKQLPRCPLKIGLLRDFSKFTEKYLYQSVFFNKVAGPRPETLLKYRLWHEFYPVNFTKFLRTPFLQNTFKRLHLKMMIKVQMTMNYFCRKDDRRKAFSLISSQEYCQGSSPLQIFDTQGAGVASAQNLSSDFVE